MSRRSVTARHRWIGIGVRDRGSPLLSMLLVLLALPAAASAQASRTWVSGVGDDANPCSRTAPCKTWAGALSKTEPGGEVDALDPGGFGEVTIAKSVTLDGGGGQVASVLAAGGANGITVQAAATDNVILRNMRVDGVGSGLNGVRFVSGASLRIEGLAISGFARDGVDDETTNSSSTLVVSNSTIAENAGSGLLVAPQSAASATAVPDNDAVDDNACGLVVSTLGTGAGPCATGTSLVGAAASVTAANSSMSANGTDGVFAGGAGARATLASDLVTANSHGVDAQEGGRIVSLCGNYVAANTTDGAPTSTVTTGCVVGPPGPTGATGATGPQGVRGERGPRGRRGRAGRIELVICKKATRTVIKHGRKVKVRRQRCSPGWCPAG